MTRMSQAELKSGKRKKGMKKNKKDQSKKQKVENSEVEDNGVTLGVNENLKSKKAKKEKTKPKVKDVKDVVEDNSVFAVTEKLLNNKKTKKEKKKTKVKDTKEEVEDNSVFAVTEKFLQSKKAKKEKKKLEGKQKVEKKKEDKHFAEVDNFFQENSDVSDMKRKIKPKWFDAKIQSLVTAYLVSVDNFEKEPTPENTIIKKRNEKKLYRFFYGLSTKLGEDISIIKYWFHVTKKDILKSGLASKPDESQSGLLKISILNRKIKAITKETTDCPVTKSADTPPAWFDEEFSELLKTRNKAKRQFKLNPTEENKLAYRLAFKKVKTELIKRKKSGFVSKHPYVKDSSKPRAKNFGQKNAKANRSFGPKNAKPNGSSGPKDVKSNKSFGPNNVKSFNSFGSSNGNFRNPNKKFGTTDPSSTNTFGTINHNQFSNSNKKHIKFDMDD